jgi:cytochrome b6
MSIDPIKPVSEWLKSRLPWEFIQKYMQEKKVPQHRHSFWYLFGGLSLFFLIVQMITGILMLLYYSPTPETAHESVTLIMTQVSYGWLIRSLHVWSAHLMIASVLVHFFSTFLMKSYRKPRELMWITGVIQLFIVLGFAFTGYLLPWDTTAYFATKIGTEIPGTIPIVGSFIMNILRGGEYVGAETLKRLFALHVVVFPITILGFVGFHLILNQIYGTGTPIGIKTRKADIRFYPNYLYSDALSWTIGIAVLLGLALLLPVKLDIKADQLAAAPPGIKPAWYFLVLYETLRIFPATLMGISGDLIVNMLVGLLGAVTFLLPFIDRKASREEKSPIFTMFGIVALVYFILMIILAYTT